MRRYFWPAVLGGLEWGAVANFACCAVEHQAGWAALSLFVAGLARGIGAVVNVSVMMTARGRR